MKPELKQRILKWTKRIVASIAVLLVALVLAGMSFQALESRSDRERFPPPGRLVDVGGHRLHLNCAGSGTPTVVLDSGAGGWSIYCSYDRAGYGWSEPGSKPRIGHRFAEELNALLVNSGTPGPYVLVGHSLGGYVVRLYVDRYPEEVAGVVLVESAHERQWTELPNEVNELMDSALGGMRVASIMARFGIMRFMKGKLATEGLSEDVQGLEVATLVRPEVYATMVSEVKNAAATADQVGATGSLSDRPLAVLSAGQSFEAFRPMTDAITFEDANHTWMELQAEFVGLSRNSRHIVNEEATHNIMIEDPDGVADAIRWVVDRVRQR